MSRIYDALRASEQSEPSRLVELIDISPKSPEERPQASVEVTEERVEIPPPEVPAREPVPISVGDYRTASLRLPASVPVFPFDGTDVKAAEQYRMLRTNLLHHRLQPKMIAITSPTPGDGKTITAVNLAGIMALKSDSRVLLIDADLRRSSVAEVMGIDPEPGLADVLRGCRVEDAIVQIEQVPKLHVLPAGSLGELNPAELLDSSRFRSLMEMLRQEFSSIVVDTTPMIAVTDFKLVEDVCDGALVVVRPDHSKRSSLLKSLQSDALPKLLGAVVNACGNWLFWKVDEEYMYYPASKKKSER